MISIIESSLKKIWDNQEKNDFEKNSECLEYLHERLENYENQAQSYC